MSIFRSRAGLRLHGEPPGPAPSLAPRRAEPVLAMNVQPSSAHVALPHLLTLGIRHVRVSWGSVHPTDWERWLPGYRRAGIEVLPLVYEKPRELVRRFGPFPYYQLLNEADGAVATYPHGAYIGSRTAEMAGEIRALDPAARIVSHGLAWTQPGVEEYLRGFLSVYRPDVLAVHIYGDQLYPEPWGDPVQVRVDAIRRHWRGALWATEIGVDDAAWRRISAREGYHRPSGADLDRRQLENLRRVLTESPRRHELDRWYWFQLTPGVESRGESQFGLVYPDWTPRPAYHWLREWNQRRP